MAGCEPRRSSRPRTTQSTSQASSSASSISGRGDRNNRTLSKTASQVNRSSSTESLFSGPTDEWNTTETLSVPRLRGRRNVESQNRAAKVDDSFAATATKELQDGDEDDSVRCICGYDEYPGPPPFECDWRNNTMELDPIFATDLTDDAAGFFVQCDVCKVWQHGACVGIMTEESSPDEYFCEECRKDYHRIFTASNGQRYAHYLPLKRPAKPNSRKSSFNKDGAARSPPKEKETRTSGRLSFTSHTQKRRSTMNSREAAYDEAEALRRAIEASKEDAVTEQEESHRKRPKRGRSSSVENHESVKRQRTASRSLSPYDEVDDEESDDDIALAHYSITKLKSRLSNSRTARAERGEKRRVDAAKHRSDRPERHRDDCAAADSATPPPGDDDAHGSRGTSSPDVDGKEGTPRCVIANKHSGNSESTTNSSTTVSGSVLVAPSIKLESMPMLKSLRPPAFSEGPPVAVGPNPAASPGASHDKKGEDEEDEKDKDHKRGQDERDDKPGQDKSDFSDKGDKHRAERLDRVDRIDKKKRPKKKKRNQYTRNRDGGEDASPSRSQSRDVQVDENMQGPTNNRALAERLGNRIKAAMHQRQMSMLDMKRRANVLLDFISQAQLELASETAQDYDHVLMAYRPGQYGHSPRLPAAEPFLPPASYISSRSMGLAKTSDGSTEGSIKPYDDLPAMDMSIRLTSRIIKFQQNYCTEDD